MSGPMVAEGSLSNVAVWHERRGCGISRLSNEEAVVVYSERLDCLSWTLDIQMICMRLVLAHHLSFRRNSD